LFEQVAANPQQEKTMDKDRVKGKAEDILGRAKRQAGELTGDKKLQAEGVAQQAKGKAQNAWGKMKDAGREALDRGKAHAQEQEKHFQNIRPKKPAA
jgi:uncharacterized protein YjbJ (UPF0337 family)